MAGIWRKRLAGGAAIAGCFGISVSWADQLVIDLSTGIESNDNLGLDDPSPGGALISDTTLAFTYTAETPVSTLALSGSGVLRFADLPAGERTSGLEDPRLSLNFSRDFSDASLQAGLTYRRADLDFSDPLGGLTINALQEADLILDRGTLVESTADLSFDAGLGQPFGARTDISLNERDYRGTSDPDLYDNRTVSADTTLRLDLSDTTTGRASFGATYYEADNSTQTERQTARGSLGLTQEISPVLVMDASLGYTWVETLELTGDSVSDGATGAVSLTRSLTNGDASVSYDITRNSNGPRSALSFGRSFETVLGQFDGSVGMSWNDDGDSQLVGSLRYVETLRTGQLSLSVNRSVSTNANDEDIVATQANLGYSHQINQVSSFDISVGVGATEDGGAGAAETRRQQSLQISYSRALTTDWNLTGGYQYRASEDSGDTASSNSVFLTLNRRFEFLR